jgi:outer membrane lipase/esterase
MQSLVNFDENRLGGAMILRRLGILGLALLVAGPATAQTFSNTIFFGDSNTDSGWFLYKPFVSGTPAKPPAGFGNGMAPPGAGTWTTNPDSGWANIFANKFGYSATPADTPGTGGNNWAIGGARVIAGFYNTWSTQQQITAYLAGSGGVADPNALYTYWIGINDLKTTTSAFGPYPGNIVSPQNVAQITTLAGQAVGQVVQLWNAGARYILVPSPNTLTPAAYAATGNPAPYNAVTQSSRDLYTQLVWNSLASKGINFIPADIGSLQSYVLTNPAPFGITSTSIVNAACGLVNSYQCTAANLVTPNANKTYFYADSIHAPDGGGHLSGAAQQIEADYFYSLVVAPSEISFLAEAPIKTRLGVVNTITNQIPLSYSTPGAFHGWVSGDVSWLKVNNSYTGFPNDPGTPVAATAGFDYAVTHDWLVGAAFSGGTTTQSFSLGGNFSQTEYAVSLYSAYRKNAVWLNAIGTWGTLSDSVNRQIPLGITTQSNQGNTSGNNISFAAETGYNFQTAIGTVPATAGMALKAPAATPLYLTHGPIVGIILQQVHIGAFAETNFSGAPTTLAFGSQLRNSAVTELGYQASLNLGMWEPYARAVWNHELADTGRLVTASLLSITAPSYSLPAVLLGRDWGTATVGTRVKFTSNMSAYAAFTSQIGQSNVTTYGGQVGLNVAFQPSAVVARY